MDIIFLTSGSTWTVPTDWNNSSNSIECIGAGGAFAGGVGGRGMCKLTYTSSIRQTAFSNLF